MKNNLISLSIVVMFLLLFQILLFMSQTTLDKHSTLISFGLVALAIVEVVVIIIFVIKKKTRIPIVTFSIYYFMIPILLFIVFALVYLDKMILLGYLFGLIFYPDNMRSFGA